MAEGYVVRAAVDGLDAIEKLRGGLPDLIISDLNMPRMSGFELLGIVRKRFPQIPVIVMSALAADEMPEGVAADAYLHKSGFGIDQLLEAISNLTRNPPLRSAAPPLSIKPVQAKWDGDGHFLLACEDCLRVFSVPRAPNLGRNQKWTICVHCGQVVRFLVADADLPGPPRP